MGNDLEPTTTEAVEIDLNKAEDAAKVILSLPDAKHQDLQIRHIHDELKAAGLVDDKANPELPIDGVRRLIEERRQLLDEMTRSVSPDDVLAAVAQGNREAEGDPDPDDGDSPTPDILHVALRAAHDAMIAVIAASERDWTRSADLAWLYGVLVGWGPDDIDEMQIRFGWRDNTVQVMEEHRAALVCAGLAE